MSAPDAVLWDMDGTIVDTEPWFADAVTTLVTADRGRLTPAHEAALVGATMADTAAVARDAGCRLDPDEIVDRVLAAVVARVRHDVPWRPGARELLAGLRAAGVPTALVTMSYRRLAQEVVDALGFPAFDVLVAGDDVDRGKPDPEPYRRAAALLGVDVTRCVVLEDSPTGIAAGLAAGATVIAVGGGHATLDWPTLAGVGVEDLRLVAA